MIYFTLTDDDRQRIHDSLVGLTGKERHRAHNAMRSRLLRLKPEYRAASNAKNAERQRAKYHANLEESRRYGAEKKRRRTARLDALPTPAPRCQANETECG